MFFTIYFYKIKISSLAWDHWMQNFINFHAIMWKIISTCYHKYEDTLTMAETASEAIIFDGSI